VVESGATRAAALLAAAFGVGLAAVLSRPEGVIGSEMWPAGLTTAALLALPRAHATPAAAGVALVGFATFLLGGRPLDFAVVGGVAVLAESLVVAHLLTAGGTRPARLVDDHDLSRFVVAVTAGAVVAGAIAGAGAWLLTDSRPLLTGLGTTAGHMSSALVLLPLVIPTDTHAPLADTSERVVQWVVTLGVTVAVFVPHDFPSLLFLLMPLLGWTALRTSLRETQLQLLAVTTVATVMTTFGFGPLALVEGRFALPQLVYGIVLQTFLIACALVVIPLALAVGQQLSAIEGAERERDLLRRVIDSAHVAIIGSDARGRLNLFNPGAERILGYSADEVLGRHTAMLYSEGSVSAKAAELGVDDDFGAVAAELARPGHAGTHMSFLRKDGTERTHAMTLSPVRDARGRVTGFVCTSADVAEEVAARQALLDALDTERRAVQRLQEVDQVKDTFVSSVSHELRTPITSIVGYLEMLLEGEFGELSAAQRTAVSRVDSNSKRLLSLIDELLVLSRVHEGHSGATGELDLREVARAAYDVVAPSWGHRDLDAGIDLPDCPVTVVGNPELLERVVVNLLGNAAKFTPDGGRVRVGVGVDEDEALLSVRDTGIGIPLEEQQHLFTRFFRSSLAQRHAIQGSGLGLSIAHAVVEEHGGRMSVTSRPGEGTELEVRVPLVHAGNVKTSTTVGP
jgi:PAS domain S-box-containing protein